jgi:UDP-glucose 4-epimerase
VSSGAAYGYHADNPAWLTETDALRGNDEFSYSRNKRLVEECLAEYLIHSPALKQLILRPGTILGASTDNMITQLLCRKRLLAIRHSTSPFVFIWDQDMLAILEEGVVFAKEGCFNVAGDGALTIAELAKLTGRSTLTLPAWLLKALLWLGNRFGITAAGPHHLLFLRYRPVLLNTALKNQFGYIPVKSSKATFMYFWQAYQARQRA